MNPTNARVRSPPVRARRVWLALFLALACAWGAALLFRFSYPARRELIAAGDPGVAVGRESDADWRGAQSWQWLAQGWTRLAERIRNVAAPHGLQNVSASGEGAAVEVEGWMDMREAASRWEQQVGCAAFRRKHGGPEAHGQHTRRGPAAFPTNPSLQDVTSPPCASLTLSHVLVDVVQPGWLEPTGLDGFHVCPRCGITCQLAWNPSLLRASLPPHAQLFVHSPDAMPLTRPPASPLRVLLQLEADATLAAAKREGRVDVAVGYAARSEVQLTYVDVERSLKAGRQHLLAPGKRTSRCTTPRPTARCHGALTCWPRCCRCWPTTALARAATTWGEATARQRCIPNARIRTWASSGRRWRTA
ncbi:hypothetical protein CLOM_g2716 [Closterium sp. NIES-68]|nr:hypothetical protein CLOM_g2716 [Closterium sp. NIES-68]GJP79700.1 hypothetical protein CLOP_g9896 [Closterium sp. NIES-67]